MPTYKLIVSTPTRGYQQPSADEYNDFVNQVNAALRNGATLVGGVCVTMSNGQSSMPYLIYTQAVLFP